MTLKTKLTTLLLLWNCCFLFGQEMERQVLTTAGNSTEVTNLSLDWTLGEMSVQTYDEVDQIICLGFHQGSALISSLYELPELEGITLFPNPVTSLLNIQSDQEQVLHFRLFDGLGRQLLTKQSLHQNHQFQLDCSSLPAGIYFLHISKPENQQFTNFKIQKI